MQMQFQTLERTYLHTKGHFSACVKRCFCKAALAIGGLPNEASRTAVISVPDTKLVSQTHPEEGKALKARSGRCSSDYHGCGLVCSCF